MLGHIMLLKMLHCKGIHVKGVKYEEPTGKGSSRSRKLDLKKLNQNSTCRVCLKQGSIPIFGHDQSDNISKGLYTFGGIEVCIDDPYPKFLCQPCYELLQGAILFRKTAQQSAGVLKQPRENFRNNDHWLDCDEDIKSENEELNDKNRKTCVKDIQNEFVEKQVKTQKINIEDIKSECKEKTQKNYHCSRCIMSFKTFDDLYEHKLSEEHEKMRQKCPICHNSYTPLYFQKHIATHKEKSSYLCDVCGKNFTLQGSFKTHSLIHSNKLPYKCSRCPYRGRGKEALKMHMRSHTGEKPYQCTDCPSRFISSSNLRKHMRTHTRQFNCQCDTCNKGFYTKREMQVHVNIHHMGIKDHVCNICGKAYGARKQMMKHQLKVHKRKKLRPGKIPLYLKLEMMNQQKLDTSVET